MEINWNHDILSCRTSGQKSAANHFWIPQIAGYLGGLSGCPFWHWIGVHGASIVCLIDPKKKSNSGKRLLRGSN